MALADYGMTITRHAQRTLSHAQRTREGQLVPRSRHHTPHAPHFLTQPTLPLYPIFPPFVSTLSPPPGIASPSPLPSLSDHPSSPGRTCGRPRRASASHRGRRSDSDWQVPLSPCVPLPTRSCEFPFFLFQSHRPCQCCCTGQHGPQHRLQRWSARPGGRASLAGLGCRGGRGGGGGEGQTRAQSV